ncbi:MAG TPA: MarR family winged helix-turn-helix transcriptional regulator [Chitinophagales bacterium]
MRKLPQNPICLTTTPTGENLGKMIGITYRHMSDYIAWISRNQGFPAFSLQYLAVLKNIEPKGITVNHLAKKILITKQAVSKMTKDLEKHGYVTLKKNPEDSRSVLIFGTPLATKLMTFISKQNQRFFNEIEEALGEKRTQNFLVDMHTVMGLVIERTLKETR